MSKSEIKLGLMPPLSGLVGIYGSEIVHAAQIACQEVNENGGVLGHPLELVIEDDGSLPESAVEAANKLVHQHHCSAIIGNLLSNSRIAVAYRVAEPNKIPLLNFSFYEGSILSRYFFHFAALPNQQIEKMIPYMRNKYGPRMFFAGNNYEWPRGSIDAGKRILEQCGGEVIGEEYTSIGVNQEAIDQLLDQVEAAKPDVFVPYFAGSDQVLLLTRFTERGLKDKIAVVMGHYDEMMASQLSPEVRENFYSSNTYFMSIDSEENKNYLKRLANLPDVTGIWPNGNGILTNFGEGTYVCVKAFAEAANKAGSIDPEALVESLRNINVRSPQGIVQMNPEHHHAQVNTYLSKCSAKGIFNIVENFGAIEGHLPERYGHQRIANKAIIEDDIRLQARMLEKMSEAILLVSSQDGSILYANTGAENMFGYEQGEMLDIPFSQINNPNGNDSKHIPDDIFNSMAKKGGWKGDIRNLKKDGTVLWCSVTVSIFTHPVYGEVWLSAHRDINELKNTEAALQDSKKLLKEAERIAKMGAWELDLVENNLKWSDETYRIFEIDKNDFQATYEGFLSLVHPDDVERVEKTFSDSLVNNNRPYETEHRVLLKNGGIKYVRERCETTFSQEGKPLYSIGIVQDITERVEQEKALRESEEKFRLINSRVPGIVYQFKVDVNGNQSLPYVSSSIENYLNVSAEDAMHDVEVCFSMIHPDDYASLSISIVESMQQMMQWEWEGRFILDDDKVVWLHGSSVPRKQEDGSVVWDGVFVDITARKNTEIALFENEAELDRIFNLSPDIVGYGNLNGEFIKINDALHSILGYKDEEFLGQSFMNFIHPNDLAATGAELQKAQQGVKNISIDNRYRCKDGSYKWLAWSVVSDLSRNEFLAVGRDISDRKKAEQALLESDLWMKSVFNSLDEAVLVVNPERELININKAAQKIFGYSAEEIFSRSTELFHVDHSHFIEFGKRIKDAFSKGKVAHFEFEGKRKNGEIFPTEHTVSLLKNVEREEIGLVSVVRDITERKQNEEELLKHRLHLEELVREGNQDLYEREQQLKNAQRIAHMGSYEWDLGSNELTWSDSAFELFGLKPNSVKPSIELFISKIHPEDAASTGEKMGEAVKSKYTLNGKQRAPLPTLDYRIIHSDGNVHWLRAEGDATLDNEGYPKIIHGTVQDISSHKLAEDEIRKAKIEADRANTAKSDFLSRMSHELRTPMNAILGFAQLLDLHSQNMDDVQRGNIQEIMNAGSHLLSLINEVLDLTEVESGKLEVSIEEVALSEVIKQCSTLISPLLEERKIKVIDNVSENNYILSADFFRLKQIMLNLLSNAVKYNSEEGLITLDSQIIDDGCLRISVTDTGKGISKEDINKLFTSFERLDKKVNIEGTGIGLVITKNLIELMNGRIGVESIDGKGCSFWIELALVKN